MPRVANETGALLADLQSRLERLVEVAKKEGREEALEEVRALVGGAADTKTAPAPKRRGRKPARKSARKPATKKATTKKTTTKKSSAKKTASKPAKKSAKKTKKGKPRKNPWAGLTDEQRLARVNAIRVGRGLPPKDSL